MIDIKRIFYDKNRGDNIANKRWKHEIGSDKKLLVFERFYEEEIVGELFKDEDGDWCYSSKLLDVEDMYLCDRDTREQAAKLELEGMIFTHYESERDYYQSMMDMFGE